MQALLGKISRIEHIEAEQKTENGQAANGQAAGAHLKIGFKAACLLPEHKAVPEWLKDAALTIERTVFDAREIGGPGDSVVLTTEESAPLLRPLSVAPDVARDQIPDALQLRLCWWKDDAPPEWSVRANGRLQSGAWQKDEDGEGWAAQVETDSFFDFAPRLPVAFEIVCDKLSAGCSVLPGSEPVAAILARPEGEVHRVENAWYEADVTARLHGGAIVALRERGRDTDHFAAPQGRIGRELEWGGHTDRFVTGWAEWSEKMRDAAVTGGTRRESNATRLSLEGVVDEGEGLRTSVTYTFHDAMPLVILQREWSAGPKKEDDKEKDGAPKELIDELRTMIFSFRAASMPERDACSGSRVLCAEDGRLTVARSVRLNHMSEHHYWRMKDGWAVVEHPRRRECMMYLFDTQSPPHLATWMGTHVFTLEPVWPAMALRPGGSVGFALALTAGELCGASGQGAWVACRAPRADGGVICGVVARLRGGESNPQAVFSLDNQTRETTLRHVLLPGVGEVSYATAEFAAGGMSQPFDVIVGGIAARRTL